jgi:hypothetical protein
MTHPASNDVIGCLQALSGMLTRVKTKYGSFPEMIEHPDWDEARTGMAIRLIKSLREHMEAVEKELDDHVTGKFG